jgi:hypothetical protein
MALISNPSETYFEFPSQIVADNLSDKKKKGSVVTMRKTKAVTFKVSCCPMSQQEEARFREMIVSIARDMTKEIIKTRRNNGRNQKFDRTQMHCLDPVLHKKAERRELSTTSSVAQRFC